VSKSSKAIPDLPPFDKWRADEVLEGDGKLWGLPHIAKVLGVSVDTARRWARDPAVPIYQPAGTSQHFALKSELMAWLRGKTRD
jgi:hypothetical protein